MFLQISTILAKYIPDAAWPYIAAIIGAALGGLTAYVRTQAKNHATTLLTNQKVMGSQLEYLNKQQRAALEQQQQVRIWLSSQLDSTVVELKELRNTNESLEEKIINLEKENVVLLERLDRCLASLNDISTNRTDLPPGSN